MVVDLERLRSDDTAWDAFVEASATPFPLQMAAWAQAKAGSSWTATRIIADAGAGPIGAQILVRRLGPGPFALGYAPRGPVATVLDAPSLEAFTSAEPTG
jgi:peptidoglycan pentaglycine glycine transferase (the first glycine)